VPEHQGMSMGTLQFNLVKKETALLNAYLIIPSSYLIACEPHCVLTTKFPQSTCDNIHVCTGYLHSDKDSKYTVC